MDPRIPDTTTAWQLWHSDTFDWESPRSLQASGADILQGLYQLWRCTLQEAILDHGAASFSRFHLTWGSAPVARVDVFVHPFDNPALRKLRHWALASSQEPEGEAVRTAQTGEGTAGAVFWKIARLHYAFLQESARWNATTIDWSAEARAVLARVELASSLEEL